MRSLPRGQRSAEVSADRLGQRVGRSAAWVVIGRLVARSSGFVATAVLARLLSPEAFGLVGFALLVNGLLEAFSQMGVKEYLIHRPSRIRPLLGTAWTMIILRSAAITVVLVISAPWIAAAFGKPEATDVLRAMALIPLIRGLTNVETVYFIKGLEFHKQFLIDSAPQVGILVVGVSVALLWPSAWALVLGYLAGALLQCAVSFLVSSSVPKLRFSLRRFRLMFGFGLFVSLAYIAGYFAVRGGEWIVASLFDSHALGLYVLAFTISFLPSVDLVKPLGRVLFPAFALIQHRPAQLQAAFTRGYGVIVALTAPLCLGLALVADDFASVVLGPQWTEITPILQVAALAALGHVASTTGFGLLIALGRPKLSLLVGAVGIVALALALTIYFLVAPQSEPALLGVALCALAAQLAQYACRLSLSLHLLRLPLLRLLQALLPTLVALGTLVLAVLAIRASLDEGLLRLAASVAGGGLTYVGCLLVFWGALRRGPVADILAMLTKLRRAPAQAQAD